MKFQGAKEKKQLKMKYRICALDTIYLVIRFCKMSEECLRDKASNNAATSALIGIDFFFLCHSLEPHKWDYSASQSKQCD